ncbi:MAG: exo-alpha-sialidase, partial [Planctomycetes bacterium]|nr:exo-alpha-sialidase [Planctomycetota bacterium]
MSLLAVVSLMLPSAFGENAPLWPTEGFVTEGQIRGEDFGFTDYLHQGNVVEAANGDLLVACKGNRDPNVKGSDLSRNALTLWRSTDGGRTWSIVPTPFPGNHVNNFTIANLMRLGNRLAMVGSRFAESYDHGRTWGSRESKGTDWQWKSILRFDPKAGDSVPPTGDRGFPPPDEMPFCYSCRPFVLRSGGLLFMTSVAWGDSLRGQVQTRNTIYFFRSDDFGYSFQYHGTIKRGALGEVMHEPALIQLPSGRLIAFLRVDNHRTDPSGLPKGERNLGGGRHMFLSYSDDEGRTWAEPWPCYIPTGRWNGSMAHALLLADHVYLAGNTSYHGPAHYGTWFSHVQRCPLVLLRFPLAAFEKIEQGTPTPMWDAARVIETSETGRIVRHESFIRRYDVGCPSTPHLIALRNGNIGLLYDTNTGRGSPLLLKFKQIAPSWVTSGQLDLWRGPRPELVPGGFRVTNSQTEVRPVRFAFSGLPIEISFTVRVGEFKPADDFWRVISVLGHGEWVSAPGYSPFSELAAIGFDAQRPAALLADTGGELVDTGIRVEPGRDYALQLRFLSRHVWQLHVNGQNVGEYATQHPGLPKSFTLGYHPAKSAAVDFTYTHVQWRGPEGPPAHDDHPWIAD